MKTIISESTITCPKCGNLSKEVMPTNSCQFFWKCPTCNTVSKPKKATVVYFVAMAMLLALPFN